MTDLPNRCRLVLTVNADLVEASSLMEAVEAGDVASVILYAADRDAPAFEQYCKQIAEKIQALDIAVLVADSTQVFGRSGVDGIFADRERIRLDDLVARFSPHNIVGCGNIKDRHGALQIGELKPDFLFFGKLGGDIKPEPHRKNLALGEWWSELVEIPSVIMGGNDIQSVIACAQAGVDFVALERAVFDHQEGAAVAIKLANQLLDENAPILEEGDE